jgi:hypothetical protein
MNRAATPTLRTDTVGSPNELRCSAIQKPVPNLSVAISTGFTRFRTASTGSGPNLSHRTAVFAVPLRYIRTETKI